MSNQSVDGFQGSQPFITDNEYKSLSLDQLRYILNQKKKTIKDSYKELSEKEKIIRDIRKLDKLNEKVKQGIDIKKNYKKKKASIKTAAPSKKKKKTFEDYYEKCIKNKKIPKDTPSYLRKALERAMYEYEQGIEIEKSALDKFAVKHVIKGIPGIRPIEYLNRVYGFLIEFFNKHKNIKFKMVLVCLMERISVKTDKGVEELEEVKSYFSSETHINFESTDSEELVQKCNEKILEDVEEYSTNGSGWYFKEVLKLEINTTEFNPAKGSSYIDLPARIKNKKAIVNIKNKDDKCFLWCILRYLYPRDRDEERINDLKKYEFSLNTKGITFPMNVNNITQFEKLNPELPGINVFSEDDKMTIYPLRESKRDCKNTIDLFLYEEDGVSHYTLIKNFHRLIRSQKTKSKDGEIFICKRCFCHYTKEELLEKHIKYCSNNQTAVITMPEPNTMLHFKNYYKKTSYSFCSLCRF